MLPCASRQKFFKSPAALPLPTWISATSVVAGFHLLSLARAASAGSAPWRAPLRHAVKATASATVHRGIDFICLLGLDPGQERARISLTIPPSLVKAFPKGELVTAAPRVARPAARYGLEAIGTPKVATSLLIRLATSSPVEAGRPGR